MNGRERMALDRAQRRQRRIEAGLCQVCGQPSSVRRNGTVARTCLRCTRLKAHNLRVREQESARGSAMPVCRGPLYSECLLCGKRRLSTEPTDRYHVECRKKVAKMRDEELPL